MIKPESYPWINPFLYPLIMFTFWGWYTQTLILFQGCSQHPPRSLNWCVIPSLSGDLHYPTPSTSINASSTQFSSVRRASWPGAPKASWTGLFVARELDVSLQKYVLKTEKTNEHFNKKPGNVTNHAGSQTQRYLLSNFHGDKSSAAQLQSLSYCWDQRSWSTVLTTIPGHVCCFNASFQSFISTSVVSRNELGTPKFSPQTKIQFIYVYLQQFPSWNRQFPKIPTVFPCFPNIMRKWIKDANIIKPGHRILGEGNYRGLLGQERAN